MLRRFKIGELPRRGIPVVALHRTVLLRHRRHRMAEGRTGIFAGEAVTADIDDPTEMIGKLRALGVGDARVVGEGGFLGRQGDLNLVVDGDISRTGIDQIEIRDIPRQHLRRRQTAAGILGSGAGHQHRVVDQLFKRFFRNIRGRCRRRAVAEKQAHAQPLLAGLADLFDLAHAHGDEERIAFDHHDVAGRCALLHGNVE